MSQRWALLLQYDGTEFAGSQWQPNRPTVQGALQAALESLTGSPSVVSMAGRTDAGVHAAGQVASFVSDKSAEEVPTHRWIRGINHFLPICDRSASRSLRRQRVRPATRCGFANLHLRAADCRSSANHCGNDRSWIVAPPFERGTGALSALGVDRNPRLRRLYATNEGSIDCDEICARGRRWKQIRSQGPNAVPSRFVSATPGPADGRSGRRGGSLPLDVGRLHSLVRGSRTRIDGTDGASLRSHAGRNRIPSAAVFNAQLSLGS